MVMAPSMEWMKLVDETYLVGMQNFLDFAFEKQERYMKCNIHVSNSAIQLWGLVK